MTVHAPVHAHLFNTFVANHYGHGGHWMLWPQFGAAHMGAKRAPLRLRLPGVLSIQDIASMFPASRIQLRNFWVAECARQVHVTISCWSKVHPVWVPKTFGMSDCEQLESARQALDCLGGGKARLHATGLRR